MKDNKNTMATPRGLWQTMKENREMIVLACA